MLPCLRNLFLEMTVQIHSTQNPTLSLMAYKVNVI